MFLLELNWLAILVAFVVAFAAGALWFGPKTFFPVWWKAMGRSEDDVPGGGNMALVFGLTAVGALVQVIAVASVISFVDLAAGPVGPLGGALTGLLLGIGFAAASSLSHRLFAGHGLTVWIIEVGSDVLNYTLVGLVIGLFG
ncbi:DUF1761 family protein [Microcella sp.]|uniref:DUF1761 family protein n=1 Tax=Microcella sp. TaxID=1913979 RepID=UPI003F6FD74A